MRAWHAIAADDGGVLLKKLPTPFVSYTCFEKFCACINIHRALRHLSNCAMQLVVAPLNYGQLL
jgi:hypothetical protein